TTGTIVGTVKDSSGAVVARATVTIRDRQTNAVRIVQTSNTGDYTVPLIPPGVYDVSVEDTGFKRAVYSSVSLAVDQTVRVDVTLQLGGVAEEVTVNELPTLVQTDTSTVGQVVDTTNVETLPLNERNFVSFALLVPGAQLPSEGSLDSTQGMALSVNGAR